MTQPDDVEIFAALDDSGNLVELGRSDRNGVYIRSNGAWWKLPQSDLSLDGKEWRNVTDEGLKAFDQADQAGKSLTAQELQSYFVDSPN